MEHIGVREVVTIAGFNFNAETILMTWLSMFIVIVIAGIGVRRLRAVPSGVQNVLEIIIGWLENQASSMIGTRSRIYMPLISSLFLFLLTSNLLGLIPFLESPTNDLNTTLALALLVVAIVHFSGIYFKGSHYIAHFFKPFAPFVVINLIEEFAKPVTLSFRLFGNILAGEILIIVLLHLVPIWMPVPSVIWLAFSIFISTVHAVIFTMLSVAYIGISGIYHITCRVSSPSEKKTANLPL